MLIAVLKEALPEETRVALMPDSVKTLVSQQISVGVERGAGGLSGAKDEDYEKAGAKIFSDKKELLGLADLLAVVNRPSVEIASMLKPESAILGFLKPLDEPDELKYAIDLKLTMLAIELMPRVTRAQNMDALSSQAMVVGYKAGILAAEMLPKMFPLLMTASGTVPPARVLVLGAGVAGLQAIATTRRLGAVVTAYDVRAAAEDQILSLGASCIKVDLSGFETEGEGGYAKELSEEALERGRQSIERHAKTSDAIITTAHVPGKKAPILLSEKALLEMKEGSVVVDTAISSGGNCALSKADQTIVYKGVTILAPMFLARSVPYQASQLYSNNITAFIIQMHKEGRLDFDLKETFCAPLCVIYKGKIIREDIIR